MEVKQGAGWTRSTGTAAKIITMPVDNRVAGVDNSVIAGLLQGSGLANSASSAVVVL